MNGTVRQAVLAVGIVALAAAVAVQQAGVLRRHLEGPAPGGRDAATARALHRAAAGDAARILSRASVADVQFLPDRDERLPGVRFGARGGAGSVGISATGFVLVERQSSEERLARVRATLREPGLPFAGPETHAPPTAIAVEFLGANVTAPLTGEAPLPGRTNVCVGDDPSLWRSGVTGYARVRATGVLPGIDVVHHARGRRFEFDFVVAPGADPSRIALGVSSFVPGETADVRLADDGSIVATARGRAIRLLPPEVYQETPAGRVAVAGAYVLRGERDGRTEVAFALADYDRSLPLVIDPTAETASFLGGTGNDNATDAKVGPAGRLYVYGVSSAPSYLSNQTTAVSYTLGNTDPFLAEVEADGTVLHSVVFGSSSYDVSAKMAIDALGRIYATGTSFGANFTATQGAYTGPGGTSGGLFVLRTDADLNVQVSTRLRDSGNDTGTSIAIAPNGEVWVGGASSSATWPVTAGAAYPARPAGAGQFTQISALIRFDADLTRVVACTWGGEANGQFSDIVPLANGNLVACGRTQDAAAPVLNAFQPVFGGLVDAYVVGISGNLTTPYFASYFGGAGADFCFGGATPLPVALDPSAGPLQNHVLLTGVLAASQPPALLPTSGALAAQNDGFLLHLAPTGSVLSFVAPGDTGNTIYSYVTAVPGGVVAEGYTDSLADFPLLQTNTSSAYSPGGPPSDLTLDLMRFADRGGGLFTFTRSLAVRDGGSAADLPGGCALLPGAEGGGLFVCSTTNGSDGGTSPGAAQTGNASQSPASDDLRVLTVVFGPACPTPPTPIALASSKVKKSRLGTAVTLSWSQPNSDPAVTKYLLTRYAVKGGEAGPGVTKELPAAPRQVADRLADGADAYVFELVAVNACGGRSEAAEFETVYEKGGPALKRARYDANGRRVLVDLTQAAPGGCTVAVSGECTAPSFSSPPALFPEGTIDTLLDSGASLPAKPRPIRYRFSGTLSVEDGASSVSVPVTPTGIAATTRVTLRISVNGRPKTLKFTLKPSK